MSNPVSDLDTFTAFSDVPIKFVDLFKEFGMSPAGMSMKGTIPSIDPVIKKRVYKLGGDTSSASVISIPAEGSRTATVSVIAHGRYAYVEIRALPNQNRREARIKPWSDYTFSIDVTNKRKYIYRLVFSSEFQAEGELQLGRIGHVKLPPPTDDRWTVFCIDLPATLAKLTSGRENATTYSHVCGMQMRASMIARGIYTSDRILSGDIFPSPMAFPVPASTRFELIYNTEWIPSEPDVLVAGMASHKDALVSHRDVKATLEMKGTGRGPASRGPMADTSSKRIDDVTDTHARGKADRTPSPQRDRVGSRIVETKAAEDADDAGVAEVAERLRAASYPDISTTPRPRQRTLPRPATGKSEVLKQPEVSKSGVERPTAALDAAAEGGTPTRGPGLTASKARSPITQGHQIERTLDNPAEVRRHHVVEVANSVPHDGQIATSVLNAAASAAIRRFSSSSIAIESGLDHLRHQEGGQVLEKSESTAVIPKQYPVPTRTAEVPSPKPRKLAKPLPRPQTGHAFKAKPIAKPESPSSPTRAPRTDQVDLSRQRDAERVALERLKEQLLSAGSKSSKAGAAGRSAFETTNLKLHQLMGASSALRGTITWTANCHEILYAVNKSLVAMSVHYPSRTASGPFSLSWGHQRFFSGIHSEDIISVTVSPDGVLVATAQGGSNPLVVMWHVQTGKPAVILDPKMTGHSGGICANGIAFNHDGSCFALCGWDEKKRQLITVFEMCTGSPSEASHRETYSLSLIARQVSDFPITRAVFSAYETDRIITCGRENARFWRIKRAHLPGLSVPFNEFARNVEFTDIAFDAVDDMDKHQLLSYLAESAVGAKPTLSRTFRMFLACDQGTVVQVDYVTRSVLSVVLLHSGAINTVVSTPTMIATGGDDGYIRLWPLDFSDYYLEAAHEGRVTSLALSADEMALVIGTSPLAAVQSDGLRSGVGNEAHARAARAGKRPVQPIEAPESQLARKLLHSFASVGMLHVQAQQYRTLIRAHSARLTTLAIRGLLPSTSPLFPQQLIPALPQEPAWVDESQRDASRALNIYKAAQQRAAHMTEQMLGREMCTASFDGTIRIWQQAIQHGTDTTELTWNQSVEFAIPGENCTCLTFKPLYAKDDFLALLDMYGAFELRRQADSETRSSSFDATSEGGRRSEQRTEAARRLDDRTHIIAAGFSKGVVRIFHVPSASVMRQLQHHSPVSSVTCVEYSPTGDHLYSIATDGKIVDCAAAGDYAAVSNWKWPMADACTITDACMALDTSGNLVAASFVEAESIGQSHIFLLAAAGLRQLNEIKVSKLPESKLRKMTAIAAAESAAIHAGEGPGAAGLLTRIGEGHVISLSFGPLPTESGPSIPDSPGKHILLFAGFDDWRIQAWLVGIQAGTCVPAFQLMSAHSGHITSISPTADGNLVVSAASDGTLRVWATSKLLKSADVTDSSDDVGASAHHGLVESFRLGVAAIHHAIVDPLGQSLVCASTDYDGYFELSLNRGASMEAEAVRQRADFAIDVSDWIAASLPTPSPTADVPVVLTSASDVEVPIHPIPRQRLHRHSPVPIDNPDEGASQPPLDIEEYSGFHSHENLTRDLPDPPLTEASFARTESVADDDSVVGTDDESTANAEPVGPEIPPMLVGKMRAALHADISGSASEGPEAVHSAIHPPLTEAAELSLYRVVETRNMPVQMFIKDIAREVILLRNRRSFAVVLDSGILHAASQLAVFTHSQTNAQQFLHPRYISDLPPEKVDLVTELAQQLCLGCTLEAVDTTMDGRSALMLLSSGIIQLWKFSPDKLKWRRTHLLLPPNVSVPKESGASFLRRRNSLASPRSPKAYTSGALTPIDACFSPDGRFVVAAYASAVDSGTAIGVTTAIWECPVRSESVADHGVCRFAVANQEIFRLGTSALTSDRSLISQIVWIGEPSFALCVGKQLCVGVIAPNVGQTHDVSVEEKLTEEYHAGPKLASSGLLQHKGGRRSSLASMAVLSSDSMSDVAREKVLQQEGTFPWVILLSLYDLGHITASDPSSITAAKPVNPLQHDEHFSATGSTEVGASDSTRPARLAVAFADSSLALGYFELDLFGVYAGKRTKSNKLSGKPAHGTIFVPPTHPNARHLDESDNARVVFVARLYSQAAGNLPFGEKSELGKQVSITHVRWLGKDPVEDSLFVAASDGVSAFLKLRDPVALRNVGADAADEPGDEHDPDAPILRLVGKAQLQEHGIASQFSDNAAEGLVMDASGCISYVRHPGVKIERSFAGFSVFKLNSALKGPLRIIAGHCFDVQGLRSARVAKGPLSTAAVALTGAALTAGFSACSPNLLFSAGGKDATTRCWNLTSLFSPSEAESHSPALDDKRSGAQWSVGLELILSLQSSNAHYPTCMAVMTPKSFQAVDNTTGSKLAVGFHTGSIRIFSLENMKEECRIRVHTSKGASPRKVAITATEWIRIVSGGSAVSIDPRKKLGMSSLGETPCLVSGDDGGNLYITPVLRSRSGAGKSDSQPVSYSLHELVERSKIFWTGQETSSAIISIAVSPHDESSFLVVRADGNISAWRLLASSMDTSSAMRLVLLCSLDTTPQSYPRQASSTHKCLFHVADRVAQFTKAAEALALRPAPDALLSPEMQAVGKSRSKFNIQENTSRTSRKRTKSSNLLEARPLASFLASHPTVLAILFPLARHVVDDQVSSLVFYDFSSNAVLRCTPPLPFVASCISYVVPPVGGEARNASSTDLFTKSERRTSIASSSEQSTRSGFGAASIGASTAVRGIKDFVLDDSSTVSGEELEPTLSALSVLQKCLQDDGVLVLGTADTQQVVLLSSSSATLGEPLAISGSMGHTVKWVQGEMVSLSETGSTRIKDRARSSQNPAVLQITAAAGCGIYCWGV